MKKIANIFTIAVALSAIISCNSNGDKPTGAGEKNTPSSTDNSGNTDTYFIFTVDGKDEQNVKTDAVLTTLQPAIGQTEPAVFKIFGGESPAPHLLITIPDDVTKPCVVPTGAPNGDAKYSATIAQGSVSLQDYPEKNFTWNSFDGVYDNVPRPNAVVITASEKIGKNYYITGTVNAIVKDPNQKLEHTVTAKFRVVSDDF